MTLRDYLKESGLSQAEFARRVGLDGPRMSRIVNGELRPPLDVAFALERATQGLVKAESWVRNKKKH